MLVSKKKCISSVAVSLALIGLGMPVAHAQTVETEFGVAEIFGVSHPSPSTSVQTGQIRKHHAGGDLIYIRVSHSFITAPLPNTVFTESIRWNDSTFRPYVVSLNSGIISNTQFCEDHRFSPDNCVTV